MISPAGTGCERMHCGKNRERMPSASEKCLWAGFGRGTRRHHEADVQHSGSKAQHPSQPAPAGGRDSIFLLITKITVCVQKLLRHCNSIASSNYCCISQSSENLNKTHFNPSILFWRNKNSILLHHLFCLLKGKGRHC